MIDIKENIHSYLFITDNQNIFLFDESELPVAALKRENVSVSPESL
jgi:hypothetical protein